jgi:hypothetical protein
MVFDLMMATLMQEGNYWQESLKQHEKDSQTLKSDKHKYSKENNHEKKYSTTI